jgi:hypothetical protein
MKYLILALLLPFTVSAEGLIKVPKNAEEIKSPGRLLDLDFSKAVDEPQEQSLEGYVRWVRERRWNDRKGFMATKARALRPEFNVACLKHFEAFGFEKVSETEIKMNCLAGSGQKITHVLDYHFRVTPNPAECDSEATIREFFSRPGMFSPKIARDYLNNLVRTCPINVEPVDSQKPVVRMVKIAPDSVGEILEDKPELSKYVNQSKKVKKDPASTPDEGKFSDPLSGQSAD